MFLHQQPGSPQPEIPRQPAPGSQDPYYLELTCNDVVGAGALWFAAISGRVNSAPIARQAFFKFVGETADCFLAQIGCYGHETSTVLISYPTLSLNIVQADGTVLLLWYCESYLMRGSQIISFIFPRVLGVREALPNIMYSANSPNLALPASIVAVSTYMHICVFFRRYLL